MENNDIRSINDFKIPKKMGRPTVREDSEKMTLRVSKSVLRDLKLLMLKDKAKLGSRSRNWYIERIVMRYIDLRRNEIDELKVLIASELGGGGG